MYKALIVDDEKMIRMGMKKVIPWEQLGIGEVYTAASATEALDVLENYKPQIMITDIQMNGMTGLELIEKARDIIPELRVVRMAIQNFSKNPVISTVSGLAG